MRRYQVLPGRTHPMMNASGSGGFILHVIKMYVRRLKLLLDSLTPAIAMMIAYLPVLERRERERKTTTRTQSTRIFHFFLGFVDERVRERG